MPDGQTSSPASEANTEWFWRIIDGFGIDDIPSDEPEGLRTLCHRLVTAEEALARADQTHPATPISDSDLQIAREAAAQNAESRNQGAWARAYRSGEWDGHPEIKLACSALALSRQADERAAAEQRAAITAAGLDPTDPCDCILGDCKKSRMYCLEDWKRENRKGMRSCL